MTYYGRNRKTSYQLGKRLGGGGEGEVYEVSGKPDLVAKIYFDAKFSPTKQRPDPRRYQQEKIETMLDQPVNPYLVSKDPNDPGKVVKVLTVAWPQDGLYDANGRFVGFVMPRVNSRHHIFEASRERERIALYPHYTWKTAVTIAFNLALAVSNVQSTGAVVGDLNSNNIMIDERGHVTLIDTDSFNIENKRTHAVYKCSVGVEDVLPPELQGKNLAEATSSFTEATDNFALAIHIFNLLMNNCHPFGCSGLNQAKASTSMNPLASNIVKGICPYVTGGSGATSPSAPDIMMLPTEIRRLFDRAFSYTPATAVKAATIANRPSAKEWKEALFKLYGAPMTTCKTDGSHVYPVHYATCPWCALKASASNSNQQLNVTYPSGPSGNGTTQKVNTKQTTQTGTAGTTGKTVNHKTRRYGNQTTQNQQIRRSPWLLWVLCILVGVVTGPFCTPWLNQAVEAAAGFTLSETLCYGILAIVFGISGCFVAYLGQGKYQSAYNAWPWLLLALLVPLLGIAASAIIGFAIFLICVVIYIVFMIAMVCIGIACLCGICSGG